MAREPVVRTEREGSQKKTFRILLRWFDPGFPAVIRAHPIRRWLGSLREVRNWKRTGKPNPPPHPIKIRNIKNAAKNFQLDTLVETGTFHGNTVASTRKSFKSVYSIEIDATLYFAARKRFAHHPSVTILHGDSAAILPELLPRLTGRNILFWLDAHHSGPGTGRGESDTPILSELVHIRDHCAGSRHVIMIDDAREFGSSPSYPTLAELLAKLETMFGTKPSIMDDAIVLAFGDGRRAGN
jgi:hypothetical protein